MPVSFGRRENVKGRNKYTDSAQISARECVFNPTRKKPQCEFQGLLRKTRRLSKDGVRSYQNAAAITMRVDDLELLKRRGIGPDHVQTRADQIVRVDPDIGNGNQFFVGEQ